MARNDATEAGDSLKRQSPDEVRVVRALEKSNVKTTKESNVMSKNTTAASNVIPFRFEKREVRTLLIAGEPWFVASDVCAALAIGNASLAVNGRADRDGDGLEEDEKGIATVNTPSGEQQMLVVSESGLYALIFKSRKKEAKRFQRWVTAEVLPTIRKHGRYEDANGTMGTLIGETIGTNGFNMLGALIKGKVASLPAPMQRSATAKIWSQTHAAFGVRSAADIPASQLDAARNFIAAYALEGEWLGKEPARPEIHFPIEEWKARNPHQFSQDNPNSSDLVVGYGDLLLSKYSPCLELLDKLAAAGHCVDGAYYEFRSYQNLLRQMDITVRLMAGSIKNAFDNFEGDRRRLQVYPEVKGQQVKGEGRMVA